jgi:hypothetical protein
MRRAGDRFRRCAARGATLSTTLARLLLLLLLLSALFVALLSLSTQDVGANNEERGRHDDGF